jgi:hypothetical protein
VAPQEPAPGPRFARTLDKGRGRLEHRTLESTPILTVHPKWPGLKQGFRVRRWGTRNGKPYEDVAHGITSLPPETADAGRLLGLVREHWRIENSPHDIRDVTRGEDGCQVRGDTAPQVLAALRNVAINRLARVGTENHAQATRRLAAQPQRAIDLLTSPV